MHGRYLLKIEGMHHVSADNIKSTNVCKKNKYDIRIQQVKICFKM